MPRRRVLTERQKSSLFDIPVRPAELVKYYTLTDEDILQLNTRRKEENRLGFALQLCALRYPGRSLTPGELISEPFLNFVGAQLGTSADALLNYAVRRQTRQEHMNAITRVFGYESFSKPISQKLEPWMERQAQFAKTNESLVRAFVHKYRSDSVILPAITTIERLCADAMSAADTHFDQLISYRIDTELEGRLEALLSEAVTDRLTRFAWLRQKEPGNNSALSDVSTYETDLSLG